MESSYCVKICYRGLVRYISYELNHGYEDIIKMAIKRFDILCDDLKVIKLSNGLGYVMDKQLFENFILLFPKPEMVFYIYLDYSFLTATEHKRPLRTSKLNNAPAAADFVQESYVASPVRRQNCFIGTMPSSEASATERFREKKYAKLISKPLRTMDAKKRMKRLRLRVMSKRNIRV